jgi:hypothetical protein
VPSKQAISQGRIEFIFEGLASQNLWWTGSGVELIDLGLNSNFVK